MVKSWYCRDVMMGAMASQITSLTIVYRNVYWGADQRKYQSSAPLAFVCGIHRRPGNSPHKGPVTWKIVLFDVVIMEGRLFRECWTYSFGLYQFVTSKMCLCQHNLWFSFLGMSIHKSLLLYDHYFGEIIQRKYPTRHLCLTLHICIYLVDDRNNESYIIKTGVYWWLNVKALTLCHIEHGKIFLKLLFFLNISLWCCY